MGCTESTTAATAEPQQPETTTAKPQQPEATTASGAPDQPAAAVVAVPTTTTTGTVAETEEMNTPSKCM
ncbi:hypothetical protein H257_16751 [Aphanomyces astaci]|uniref:Uncharacterized protein n=1 Tax=Aphanomyces astaci TaxID=112090 RepID=W4FJC7_APHAT|nr:hypothetical protein H257_16751 [Aphanomyces astaci]ETV66951.1 hypothetical protein H257_16751 [Aphanomyces astaci]|eukprot:XP_009843592.1 hypothetical protein H257_16751 [Aphanomyces astaci]